MDSFASAVKLEKPAEDYSSCQGSYVSREHLTIAGHSPSGGQGCHVSTKILDTAALSPSGGLCCRDAADMASFMGLKASQQACQTWLQTDEYCSALTFWRSML